MSHKLKVFGVLVFRKAGQVRAVAATTSQAKFAKLTGSTIGYIRDYACETANPEEVKVAMSYAEALWVKCPTCETWHREEKTNEN